MIERLTEWARARTRGSLDFGRAVRATARDTWQIARSHRRWTALAVAWVVAIAVTALVFPGTAAGDASFLLLIAITGVAVAWARDTEASAAIPAWLGPVVAYLAVLWLGVHTFAEPWAYASIWKGNDWGTHHAILSELVDGLRGDGVPRWSHGLTTGEPAFDLYPSFPYYLAAALGWLFGSLDDLPLVLTRMAIALHVLTALAAVRLGLRLVPWPLALLAGVLTMVDRGAGGVVGGYMGSLYWGVFHSALAVCLWTFALSTLIDHLRRPRLRTSVLLWLLASAALLCHPVALFAAGATVVALLAVAVLANDVPGYRSAIAAGQVILVVLVTALVWMPLVERIGLYAVHYGEPPLAIDAFFDKAVGSWTSFSNLGAAVALGLVGVITGLLSRRAAPTFLAVLSGALIIAATDQLYLLLELGPSNDLARMSPRRMLPLAKPGVFVLGMWILLLAAGHLRGRWRGRGRLLAGSVLAMVAFVAIRGGTPYLDARVRDMRAVTEFSIDDDEARALFEWARTQAGRTPTGSMARLMHEKAKHELYHVHAETKLPFAALGEVSNLLLRERIPNGSPASLRRFNVRWVIRHQRSPLRGHPASEIRVGNYRIRQVASWDGQFARVERGEGTATVTRLDNHRVDVELTGTDRPSLVALGTGYYPRWRARHADGRRVPVYAMPAVPNSPMAVVAAWLPPGRTSFTPNGSLPSDGKGVPWSAMAALGLLGIAVAWSTRWRWRALRRMAAARRWLHARRDTLLVAGAAAMALGLVVLGAMSASRSDRALQVGHAMGPTISAVDARRKGHGDAWSRCDYRALAGMHACGQLLHVRDTVTGIVNDHKHSWPFQAPAVRVITLEPDRRVDYRIRARMELAGDYWIATRGAAVIVKIEGRPEVSVPPNVPRKLALGERAEREVVIRGVVGKGAVDIAFLRADTLDPERNYPRVPEEPPASLR